GALEMKRYLQFILAEARIHFDRGRSSADAARRIDPGPFARWSVPSRMWVNVERAYRQFRGEKPGAAWSHGQVFDSMLALARKKGFPIEF
ncbi:MAG: hypothetical protein R3236_01645, partial [Phycisphaeraceae bacterium]|nr:hypothetical protein [Phycisphaeraceae bacterium]